METRGVTTAPHQHTVAFCDSERETVLTISDYVAEGFQHGEPVLVVATAARLSELDAELDARGYEPVEARALGTFVTLDAESTLDTFMVDGSPDPDAFRQRIGGVVDAVRGDADVVRVFGEMVALLWDDDNVAGAIELEDLWNSLAVDRNFTLLCAYASTVLDADALSDIGLVCDRHTTVLSPDKYLAGWPRPYGRGNLQWSEVFLPVPEAVPAVRCFAVSVLEFWDTDHLAADAGLVITEMAALVATEMGSPFRACLERTSRGLRVSLEEAGQGAVSSRVTGFESVSDPGMTVIAGVADRWGWEMDTDRKVLWAEFVTSPSQAGLS
ncbi:MEDS domain-containing protein [Nocardioides sp.]|uniref:MEDS domain-containing protein n=1 Tax=Nocardioides sp. TaxID=35761 RepID=UPI003564D458